MESQWKIPPINRTPLATNDFPLNTKKMKTQKMQDAMRLFFHTGLTKTEIADYLQVSRRTVNYWAKDMEWEQLKNCAAHTPALLADNCYRIMARLQSELLTTDAAEPLELRKINSLCKLTNTIRTLTTRQALSESIELRDHLLAHVQAQNPEAALLVQPYIDSYLVARAQENSKGFAGLRSPQPAVPAGQQAPEAHPGQLTPQQLIDLEEARLDQEDFEYWAQNPPSTEEMGFTPGSKEVEQHAAWANPRHRTPTRMEMPKNQGLNRAQRCKLARTKAAA